MRTYKEYKEEKLRDKNIRREYDLLESEFLLVQRMIDLRLKQEMTQQELAEKIGTKQSAISRFERGAVTPTLSFLAKTASALGKELFVELR